MNERDRLIELLETATFYRNSVTGIDWQLIADHLLDNGVIVPPCKVGQTVYLIMRNGEIIAFEVIIANRTEMADGVCWLYESTDGKYPMGFTDKLLGKTVFLTREEAEQALKEREQK